MQHSNYQTTSKHYIDRKEIAKDMVKHGFRVFPKQSIDSELVKIERFEEQFTVNSNTKILYICINAIAITVIRIAINDK